MLSVGLFGCAVNKTVEFDIAEGPAASTLKTFAKQANVEIIFDLESVSGVSTNPVRGKYESDVALRMMIEGTPLMVNFENETGAYAVFRKK